MAFGIFWDILGYFGIFWDSRILKNLQNKVTQLKTIMFLVQIQMWVFGSSTQMVSLMTEPKKPGFWASLFHIVPKSLKNKGQSKSLLLPMISRGSADGQSQIATTITESNVCAQLGSQYFFGP